jgi:hypothetical protein
MIYSIVVANRPRPSIDPGELDPSEPSDAIE